MVCPVCRKRISTKKVLKTELFLHRDLVGSEVVANSMVVAAVLQKHIDTEHTKIERGGKVDTRRS